MATTSSIDTTNFTFDPDGMDDHLHMASSVRKKVTERYQFIDDDNMRMIITLDDPTFSDAGRSRTRSCSPETPRNRGAGWSFVRCRRRRGERWSSRIRATNIRTRKIE